MDSTGVDIQQKIATLQGGWDDTVGTPYVLKINPTMLPVAVAAVSSDKMDVAELSEFVENTLTSKMEGITGVASVSVSGLVQRQMNVILSQEKMDLSIAAPMRLYPSEHFRYLGILYSCQDLFQLRL